VHDKASIMDHLVHSVDIDSAFQEVPHDLFMTFVTCKDQDCVAILQVVACCQQGNLNAVLKNWFPLQSTVLEY
jgi:hypothetical protein